MTDEAICTCHYKPSHERAFLLCLLVALFLVGCSGQKVKFADPSRPGPVVILGDSLAAAYLIEPDQGFVSLLSERLDREIVNLGTPGITTKQSLPRVAEEVLPLNPSLVIIELGGNDALQKIDPDITQEHLATMIEQVHARKIPVLLLGVRGGVFSDKLESVYADLSSNYELAYVPDILDGILTSPGLRVDNVHPNPAGHQLIADKIEPVLAPLLNP